MQNINIFFKISSQIMVNNICPSNLKEHFFTLEMDDHLYNYRILKMKDSLFIYIGEDKNEQFNEMAMAMPSQTAGSGEILKTTILGDFLVGESQEFARNFSKKLDKLVFVSCNVSSDRDIRALLEKRISQEIKNVPEAFL